jgi:S1-C subfamily serine protease
MSERDVMIDLSYLDEDTSESTSRSSSNKSDKSTTDAKSKKSTSAKKPTSASAKKAGSTTSTKPAKTQNGRSAGDSTVRASKSKELRRASDVDADDLEDLDTDDLAHDDLANDDDAGLPAVRPAVAKLTADKPTRKARRASHRKAPERSRVEQPTRAKYALARRRNGGVAPFVPPSARRSRRQMRRDKRRHGFVALTQDKVKRRHKILPRSLIGICFTLLALGLGCAVAGAAFYAYYDNRLAESEDQISAYVDNFEGRFTEAADEIDLIRDEGVDTIQAAIGPLEDEILSRQALAELGETVSPSVWLVDTLAVDGRVSVGTAFVVSSNDEESLLLTSYDVVAAASVAPGPEVSIVKGEQRMPAELFSWDTTRDLALLRVTRPEMPTLEWASEGAAGTATGKRVFAGSGYGAFGASVSPGYLTDTSSTGYQHTSPLSDWYRGGPLMDGAGKVYGVVSTSFSPLDVDQGEVKFAVPIADACLEVLTCTNLEAMFPDDVADDSADVDDETSLDNTTGVDLSELEDLTPEQLEELQNQTDTGDAGESDSGDTETGETETEDGAEG